MIRFLLLTFSLLWIGSAQQAHSQIIVSAGGEVQTIAAALELASPGDFIRVEPGHYREHNLVIDKPVTLEGIGNPLVDGEGNGTLLVIRANEVTVRGFDLRNTGRSHINDYAAILIDGASNVTIEQNRLQDIFFGIYLAETQGSLIQNNQILSKERRETASGNGIHLWNSKEARILNNRIEGQRDGIYLEFVTDTEVSGNHSSRNNRYGLHFMFSNDCVYRNNEFRDNGAGVAVMYSRGVDMTGNRFEHNWGASSYGLLLKDMTDGRIEGNRFVRNTTAIYSEGGTGMVIHRNHFELNGWAIKVRSNTQNNRFTENNFIENSFDVATDSRRNPNLFEENYWSHYEGYDLDRDGIGDVPYYPVRLFSVIVERQPESLILLRSLLITLLETAERIMPVLTPATMVDERPRMEMIR